MNEYSLAKVQYFNNLSPARMYNAYITSEITRQSKNQPFSIFFLKMADFYTVMVHQISAKCKIIAEIYSENLQKFRCE